MTYRLIFLLLLLLAAGCSQETDLSKEIQLKETLAFSGIDASISYDGTIVDISYEPNVEGEFDTVMQTYYIFGAAHLIMPESDQVIITSMIDGNDLLRVSADMDDISAYLEENISSEEFRQFVEIKYLV